MTQIPTLLETGIMDKKLFGDLPFGTRFIFYGKTYTKIALNMAEDEKRYESAVVYPEAHRAEIR